MLDSLFFITIVNENDAERFTVFYESQSIPVLYRVTARGTASDEILAMLGLRQNQKCVLFAQIAADACAPLMEHLRYEMQLDQPGNGIAFTIPAGKDSQQPSQFTLIAAVTNEGYEGHVMDAARSANARGGTIVKADAQTRLLAEHLTGAPVPDGRNLIFIVVPESIRAAVMDAVAAEAGADTLAQSILLSLPVVDAVGLSAPAPHEEA